MTKSENDSAIGAFIGGFFEGAVSGAALALGLAIGTISGGVGYILLGGAIALVGGFIGGKYGNAITQQISYGNVDWVISNFNGIRSGVMNLYSYICFGMIKDILSNSNRLIKRFVDNLFPSTLSVAISIHLGLLPKIFSNNNRDEERIESQDGRFIWDYLF